MLVTLLSVYVVLLSALAVAAGAVGIIERIRR